MRIIRNMVLLLWAVCMTATNLFAQRNLKAVRSLYQKDSTAHFTYYFQPHSLADSARPFISKSLEQYRTDILAMMGEAEYAPRMEVFFFSTAADFQQYLKSNAQGISFAKENVACFIFSRSFNGYSRHEIAHLISINLWGHSALWMEEGFATLCDETFQQTDFHAQATALLENGNFIEPTQLMKHFNMYGGQWRRYVAAASLLKFLNNEYGTAALKKSWQNKTLSVNDLSTEEVIEKWVAFLKK